MNQSPKEQTQMKKILLVPVLALAILAGACGVAQWVKIAQEILPVVLPMVTNLVTAVGLLEGKTVSAQDLSTITRSANQVSSDLNLAGQLINQYESSPDTTTIAKIDTMLTEVNSNLNSLLPALHISDPATAQKISAVVTLISTEVNSMQQILPVISAGGKPTLPAGAVPLNASALKKQYNAIVAQPTSSTLVNQAFAGAVLQ
ncbi:MAG: hypothetical protein ACRD1N_01175 [Terriglobia bacterium]